jgi:hypothetical protein
MNIETTVTSEGPPAVKMTIARRHSMWTGIVLCEREQIDRITIRVQEPILRANGDQEKWCE